MTKRVDVLLAVAGLWVITGCPSEPGRMVGEPCAIPADCPENVCADVGGGGAVCSRPCGVSADCPAPYVCGDAAICVAPCAEGVLRGSGADREICRAGVFVACSGLDPALVCSTCGCMPFGGGICRAGTGCVSPLADGESCSTSRQCASMLCLSDTRVCGAPRGEGESCGSNFDCQSALCLADGTCGEPAPDGTPCVRDQQCASGRCLSTRTCGPRRAIGEPCSIDSDCLTSHCSTNGRETEIGVCYQELGTACVPDGCSRCLAHPTVAAGICSRSSCDPVDAPDCPAFDSHVYSCAASVSGSYHCYERCSADAPSGEPRDHDCLSRFETCRAFGDFCRE